MKIEAGKIKSWVERIERLLGDRADINGGIKDIYTEVKSNEHDAKAIRKLIQRRGMDPADLVLQDDLLTAYTDAIAGKIRALDAISKGASTKEAAKAGGVSTGSVSALRRVQKSRVVNHDPVTGEITPTVEIGRSAAEHAAESKSTAGPEQGAVSRSLPPDDASQVGRIEEPPATPVLAAGASAGTSAEQEALAAREEEGCLSGRVSRSDEHSRVVTDYVTGWSTTIKNVNWDNGLLSSPADDEGACMTQAPLPTPALGAVAEGDSPQRVATDEIDLTPPPRLLEKRREIEARRAAT